MKFKSELSSKSKLPDMHSIHTELFSSICNPGILTEKEIDEYVSKFGFSLPADYLEFIKTFHGGIEGPVGAFKI